MKLGGKSKDVDSFVDQLKSEGETVASDVTAMKSSKQVSKTVASQPQIKTERWLLWHCGSTSRRGGGHKISTLVIKPI